MERISSGSANIGKTIFAVVWFGFLAIFFAFALVGKDARGNHSLIAILFPLAMAGVGYFIMKKSMGGFADEVLDAGDSLVVRFGGEQEQIPLSNIINVGYAPKVDPYRVTLTLRVPSRFGQEISFYSRKTFLPLTGNPIITELIQRIDAARQAAR